MSQPEKLQSEVRILIPPDRFTEARELLGADSEPAEDEEDGR
jgi:hypothetical protein